jgi:hypothetical protein
MSSVDSSPSTWCIEGPFDHHVCGFASLRAHMGKDHDYVVNLEKITGFGSITFRHQDGHLERFLLAEYPPNFHSMICGPGAGRVLAGITLQRETEIWKQLNEIVDVYRAWEEQWKEYLRVEGAERPPQPTFPKKLVLKGEWSPEEAKLLFKRKRARPGLGEICDISAKRSKLTDADTQQGCL